MIATCNITIEILKILLLISLICAVCTAVKQTDVRNYLGTRTPYRFRSNKNDSQIKFPSNLKKQQIEMLEEWSSNMDADEEKNLAMEGQDEMVLLAERMMKRFPNAIQKKYNNETFHFKYTATERAQQSARYFTIGLFDKKKSNDVIFAPATRVDPVLRFYKHCDRWLTQVKRNPETYNEVIRFGRSLEMNQVLDIVSKRLGLARVLSLDEVNLIYEVCGFETAWSKYYKSPWCEMLDVENAKVLEYYHDLKLYWKDGYAHNLTYRQACLSIKNMFENFSAKSSPNATFLFAHSGTILKIIAHLQLYKPEKPLLGDRIYNESAWKASHIDCFATNLAFVMYKCQNEDFVLTLHQEKIIKLPMCDEELCSLKTLKEHFHDSIYNCDYTDMCSLR